LQSHWRIGTAGIVFVPGIKCPYYSLLNSNAQRLQCPHFRFPPSPKSAALTSNRSGNQTRAASALYRAFNTTPSFVEDADGHQIRQWEASEIYALRHDDIKTALTRHRIVEREDMLEFVPSGSITYALTRAGASKTAAPAPIGSA
jgi:hypothetical protein